MTEWEAEEIILKKNLGIHICSKCLEESMWGNNGCPHCGSVYFYPYHIQKISDITNEEVSK